MRGISQACHRLWGAWRTPVFAICLVLAIAGVATCVHQLFLIHLRVQASVQTQVKIRGQYVVQQMTHYCFRGQGVVDRLVSVLERQEEPDVQQLLRDAFDRNKDIALVCVAFSPDAAVEDVLQAPYLLRADGELSEGNLTQHEEYADYASKESPSAEWYRSALAGEGGWSDPFFDPITQQYVIAYAAPFTGAGSGQPTGVTAVFYQLRDIKTKIASLGTSGIGNLFIISPDGRLVYHIDPQVIADGKSVEELATGKQAYLYGPISENYKQVTRGIERVSGEMAGPASWLYFQRIPVTGWLLVVSFIDEGIVDVAINRQQYVVLLMAILLLALFLALALFFAWQVWPFSSLIVCAAFYSSMAVFATGTVLWFYRTALTVEYANVVSDGIELQRFLDRIEQAARARHEKPPLQVPTGVLINTIDLKTFGFVFFTGYLWQRFGADIPANFERGVNFPQAHDIDMKQSYSHQKDDITIIGWEVNGKLTQEDTYAKYPFDRKRIKIVMESADETRNVVLVPDLASYPVTSPSSRPAFNESFLSTGLYVIKTFFSFDTYAPKTNLGMSDVAPIERIQCSYNILLNRNLLHSFIIFFLPLLVVLFMAFALLYYLERRYQKDKPPITLISIYSSLFFTALIGHQLFRRQFDISIVTYIEYFFFCIYLTVPLLIFYGLYLVKRTNTNDKRFRFLFWPAQTTFWFVVTAILFYH